MAEAQWYVVHTYSGYENKVKDNLLTLVENRRLQDVIPEVRVPTEIVPEVKDGKARDVEHKLFPGYVFVKMRMTDETWYIVRNTRGVTGFVGPSSKPVPLSQAEVDALGVETRELVVDYTVGANVEIIDGPMTGFIGVVDSIDTENKKVKVMVSMFGRDTVAEMDLTQVKPV
ncbi:MAG: transcription termination/antitermination protein NusG [Oscillospiraceae bacterium]|nr:transcription termination/antitermination protein NusG [Oscillospiraceae bacterium]